MKNSVQGAGQAGAHQHGRRSEWEFAYSAEVLADAAEEKRQHHERELQPLMEWRKELGAHIRAAAATSLDVDQLDDIDKTIHWHRQKMDIYASWVRLLSAHPGRILGITHDDFLFFFGD